jgi:hypothetical protein
MLKSASVFAQVLSIVSRKDFSAAVKKHNAQKGAKGFSCWDQFVAMMFCQLGGANSLREICGGLATAFGKLRHLGMAGAPSKSTLSYANTHRPWQLYEDVFYSVLGKASEVAALKKRKFSFKNPLRSIDASTIDLCLEVFDWAKFRCKKGAIKLHLMLDHQGCLPCWGLVTDGKTHDVKPAKGLRFEAGTIVAMDKGYNDYSLFADWCRCGVYFVTRLKSNAQFKVVRKRKLPKIGNVLADEDIVFTRDKAMKDCPYTLRRVVIWDAKKEREIVLLTNHLDFGPTTIGKIYKERWQIELFFKALKQNLKVKTFVGTNENAVKVQIWTALIAILLLKLMKLKSSFDWSLSSLAAMVRMNLLTYRELWPWLDNPYKLLTAEPEQFAMPLFLKN